MNQNKINVYDTLSTAGPSRIALSPRQARRMLELGGPQTRHVRFDTPRVQYMSDESSSSLHDSDGKYNDIPQYVSDESKGSPRRDSEGKYSDFPRLQEGKYMSDESSSRRRDSEGKYNDDSTSDFNSDYDTDMGTTTGSEPEDLDPPPPTARRLEESDRDEKLRLHNEIVKLKHLNEVNRGKAKRQKKRREELKRQKQLLRQFKSVTDINTKNSKSLMVKENQLHQLRAEIEDLRRQRADLDPTCFDEEAIDNPAIHLCANNINLDGQAQEWSKLNADAAQKEEEVNTLQEKFDAFRERLRGKRKEARCLRRKTEALGDHLARAAADNQYYQQFVDLSTARMRQEQHRAEMANNARLANAEYMRAEQGVQQLHSACEQFHGFNFGFN